MSLRLQRRARTVERLQTEWYKQTIGTWPYSFDVMNILRGVLPSAILGGVVGKVANSTKVGGAVGAASAALARGQLLTEVLFYPEEFKELPPDTVTHNVFLILFESLLAGLAAFGISALIRRL